MIGTRQREYHDMSRKADKKEEKRDEEEWEIEGGERPAQ